MKLVGTVSITIAIFLAEVLVEAVFGFEMRHSAGGFMAMAILWRHPNTRPWESQK